MKLTASPRTGSATARSLKAATLKLTASQLTGLAIAVAAVLAGKHYYRNASADELAWLLAPTAHLVSIATGAHFVREAGTGWVDRNILFLIAPVCAGCQFLFAGFLVLAIARVDAMRTWLTMANRLALSAAGAYVATLAVNTIRIALAVWMHTEHLSSGDLHRLEGIVIYFGGLCALYALATSARRPNRFRLLAMPMAIYLVITIGFPIINGAASRPDFARHAATIALACGAIAGLALALGAGGRFVAHRWKNATQQRVANGGTSNYEAPTSIRCPTSWRGMHHAESIVLPEPKLFGCRGHDGRAGSQDHDSRRGDWQ